MDGEWLSKLESTTLKSTMLTHSRLKHLAKMAQTSEDHISRIGMGLSLRMGSVSEDWEPYELGADDVPLSVLTGKSIRGTTLFKTELPLFCALTLVHQVPDGYDAWRQTLSRHWERGVQLLTQRASDESDWLRVVANLPL